jgi:hypothetical protein
VCSGVAVFAVLAGPGLAVPPALVTLHRLCVLCPGPKGALHSPHPPGIPGLQGTAPDTDGLVNLVLPTTEHHLRPAKPPPSPQCLIGWGLCPFPQATGDPGCLSLYP